MTSRTISMASPAPSVMPGAPRGSRYSRPRSSVATALRPPLPMLVSRAGSTLPAASTPSSLILASTISPFSRSAMRVSPIPRSTSHSGNRISRAFQEHPSFREREADNVGIAARDVPDIDFAVALERIATGLAAPLAVACVMVDLVLAQPLHRDLRLDEPLADAVVGHRQGNAGQH